MPPMTTRSQNESPVQERGATTHQMEGGQPPAQLAKESVTAKIASKAKGSTSNVSPPAARRDLPPPATKVPQSAWDEMRATENGNEAIWAQVVSKTAKRAGKAKARKAEMAPAA